MQNDLGAAIQRHENELKEARIVMDTNLAHMEDMRPKHFAITRCPECGWKGHATYWLEDQEDE